MPHFSVTRPSLNVTCYLKRHAQGALHDARRHAGGHAEDASEVPRVLARIRRPEVQPVERVERLDAHLQLGASTGRERLVQSEVNVLGAGPSQAVAPRAPEGAERIRRI